jgi:hypothetical protein
MDGLAAFAVETFLVPSALGRLIVPSAPRVGQLPTMVLPAAELAAQIPAARVTGMREEAYATVATPHRAVLQVSTATQDGIQRELILTNERLGAIVLVPILAKSKNFRDGYSKITRFSVKMLIGLGISSSYPLDANASRGRARIFCAPALKIAPLSRASESPVNSYSDSLSCPIHSTSLRFSKSYLERKNKVLTTTSDNDPTSFLSK